MDEKPDGNIPQAHKEIPQIPDSELQRCQGVQRHPLLVRASRMQKTWSEQSTSYCVPEPGRERHLREFDRALHAASCQSAREGC